MIFNSSILQGEDKINNSEIIKAVAQDQIQIGDTVYTLEQSPCDIYADNNATALDSHVRSVSFSPNGKTLVLGGYFSGYAKVYSVSGNTITYVSDIYSDGNNTALDDNVYSAAFSPDGKILILGGNFDGYCKVYSVSGNTITYVSDIYADGSGTALNYFVQSIAFSPDGKTLVLGGIFNGYAKVYSVSGTTITYVSNIYADTGTTALDYTVNSVAFSPDGKILVLGGNFNNYCKVYSVSGNTITYVSNIYADASNTALSSAVYSARFSPDGNALVLGGNFSGRAKIYSVSDTTVTYASDIYKDNSSTAFGSTIKSAVFSPDGNTLLVTGASGDAKIYSANGTTLTYISDVYADGSGSKLNSTVNLATFSPNGKTLVLSGDFVGYGRVYGINGTTVCYSSIACIALGGDFTELPFGAKLGFSKSTGEIGEEVTVKTVGDVAVDYNVDTELATQDDLIAQINSVFEQRDKEALTEALPTLSNPASADKMLSGYDIVNEKGEVVTGTISTVTQATPTVSVDSAGLITATNTQSTTGYVAAGTKSATKQLTAKAAATITPSTSNQTIAAGQYTTGVQTIKGDANLKAENIVKGTSIFGVTGTAAGFPNGTEWTQSNITSGMYRVYYANGVWVACNGYKNVGLYYSTDGKTWTQSNITNIRFYFVYNANGLWVAGTYASSKGLYYSIDGMTWSQSNITSGDFYTAYNANGLWVAGSYGDKGLYYSIDGMTWTQSNITSGTFYTAYNANGLWVAGGDNVGLYYSADGMMWTQSNITTLDGYIVYYANGIWVAGTDKYGGSLYYSTDGKNWTKSSSKTYGVKVVYNANGLWVAGATSFSTGLYYSTDGMTWTQSNITSGTFYSLYYANGIWAADKYYSTDGMTWTQSNITSAQSIYNANGIWVAANSSNGLYYSVTWEAS